MDGHSAPFALRGEEDHVANRLFSGQHHHQPVDPEAEAAGRRHAVRERLHVVRVALLGLGVAARALLGLHREPLPLLLGVVQLGERVPELHPADVELEPLRDRRVVVGRPRERRQLDRIVVEDRRLDQARLDVGRDRLVDELRPGPILRDLDAPLGQALLQLVEVTRPQVGRRELVDEPHALPRRLEVDLVPLEGDAGRPDRLRRHELDQPLHPGHRVPVVGVRLVPLELRELRVVLVADALVAEVLAQLVDLLEPAHDQPLQVQLGRDPEIEVGVELVRTRHERLGEAASVARLQDRRLDLDEPLPVEEPARGGHDSRPQQEVRAHVLVHQEVEVTATIALLDVGEAVERVRQRCSDPAQQDELVDDQRGLAASALRRVPGDADDVAEVHVDLPRARERTEQLDPARAVDEIEEHELPHVASRQHPPREAARLRRLGPGLEPIRLGPHARDLVAVREALLESAPAPAKPAPPLLGRLRQDSGSWALDHSPGARAPCRRLPLPHDPEAVPAVERQVRLVVRQQHDRQALARCARETRLEQRAADPPPLGARLDADAREVPVRPSGDIGPHQLDRAPVGEERPRRAPEPRGVVTSARSVAATRTAGRPGGSHRAAPRTSPAVDHTSAVVTSKPARKSGGSRRVLRSASGISQTQAGSSWNARASTALAAPYRSGSSRTISMTRPP